LRKENCRLKSASAIRRLLTQCALVLALFFYSPNSLAAPKAKNRIVQEIEGWAEIANGWKDEALGPTQGTFFTPCSGCSGALNLVPIAKQAQRLKTTNKFNDHSC
jgi:hypothetical protein